MNKSYIEFNSDLFLCNTITNDNASETYIDTNEDCNSKKEDKKLSCEQNKNFAYRNWYSSLNQNSSIANHNDSKSEYNRIWIQTCNLGIGILLLSIGIYYQQSE